MRVVRNLMCILVWSIEEKYDVLVAAVEVAEKCKELASERGLRLLVEEDAMMWLAVLLCFQRFGGIRTERRFWRQWFWQFEVTDLWWSAHNRQCVWYSYPDEKAVNCHSAPHVVAKQNSGESVEGPEERLRKRYARRTTERLEIAQTHFRIAVLVESLYPSMALREVVNVAFWPSVSSLTVLQPSALSLPRIPWRYDWLVR